MADLAIVSVAVFEAKKEAHEKASKEGEKEPTVSNRLQRWSIFDNDAMPMFFS